MSDIYEVNSFVEMNEVIDQAQDQGKRTVVLFSALSWCQPCIRFNPIYKKVASDADDIVFVEVDIDTNDWAQEEFGIKSVPSAMLFENDGTFSRNVKVPQNIIPFINDIRS